MRRRISRLKQAATHGLEGVLIIAVAVMVLVVLWGILTRFIFVAPSRWTEEVATNLLIWVALLGAAVAFGRQEHLGLDYFVAKLDPGAQRVATAVVLVVVCLFAATGMIYGGYLLVSETLRARQLTPVLGMKMGYVYLAVPISGLFIVLYSAEKMAQLLSGTAFQAAGDHSGERRHGEAP
ncbi:MAG TPA: TRAP transporter small permease [Lacipirellulaceae bacterium]|nr:TRAP transporter small permease [Lacipirellulaceae bacterium]